MVSMPPAELNLSFTSQCAKVLRLIVHMDAGNNAKDQSNMVRRYARKEVNPSASRFSVRWCISIPKLLLNIPLQSMLHRHIEEKNS